MFNEIRYTHMRSAAVLMAFVLLCSPTRAQAQPNIAPHSAEAKIATAAGLAMQTSSGKSNQATSLVFSFTGLLALAVVGLGALLVVKRRRRIADSADQESEESIRRDPAAGAATTAKNDKVEQRTFDPHKVEARKEDRRKNIKNAEAALTRQPHSAGSASAEKSTAEKHQRNPDTRPAASGVPAVIFGAYRVDQEVAKLVSGKPYSNDVLASRAGDDRRAIETFLIKALHAPESDEQVRNRARTALEEYGFVARQNAVLLLGVEPYERAAAARTLGEIRASAALPFLIDALYDSSHVVRGEAVTSLGALGDSAAIGALLDAARRHPDVPAALLTPALSACSIESIETSWNDSLMGRTLTTTRAIVPFTGEITGLEPPEPVEQLPEWLEDETLTDALERLSSADVEARIAAAQCLAQFQVQPSVKALTMMAASDEAAAVRAAAITSLSAIDHESVFPPVLLAMADDAREVRAAAARAFSRLSFERADAYVRAIEFADAETLRAVAQACVKTGLASQALDRLVSEDRRQAYEAFSLLSLMAKAGETKLLLQAIENHREVNVSLAALRLLCMMGQPGDLAGHLRDLAARRGVSERVRVAVLEAVSKLGQPAMEMA